MTVLTELQQDALTELINIGFSRTAASLSELTGHRIFLEVPQASIHPIDKLFSHLSNFVEGEVATVNQIFTGSLSGNALLLLNYEGAVMLTDLLKPAGEPPTQRLDSSACEVLTEVGNILLNACLSVFGNLLQVYISFSVPRLHLESLNVLLDSLMIGHKGMRYAIVIYTGFKMRESSVDGYLVMVFSVTSLESLIQAIEHWANLSPSTSQATF